MDVVACSTFVGQDLQFIDNERFAHVSARGLCIYDTVKGPRDMIWQHEHGLCCFASHVDSSILIFSGQIASEHLELSRVNDSSSPPTLIPNPCKCAIMKLAISREAERLYGLSGMIDHRLTIWSLDKIPQALVSEKLDIICSSVTINPSDPNAACIYGGDGLRVAKLYDVFGVKSLQIETVREAGKDGENVFATNTTFCLWLPNNRILAIFQTKEVYEINADTKEGKSLGKFVDPVMKGPKREVTLDPTCATITINHLIVGTKDGFVYWYPLGTLLAESPSGLDGGNLFSCPVQMAKVHASVSSLVIDPNKIQLVIGTIDGQIFKVAVDVEVVVEVEKEQDKEDILADQPQRLEYKRVTAESIGNDVTGTIVLCSKFTMMGVKKITSKAKATLTFLMMGSHGGMLNFWRHTNTSADVSQVGGGIRRSAPRMVKEILSIRLKSLQGAEGGQGGAICSMEIVPWKSHSILVYLGTDSGFLEIWKIEAVEHDEDDTREAGELETKLVEDDEGGCVVQLETAFQLKAKVFKSALSSIGVLSTGSGLDAETRVMAASCDDHLLYVFSAVRDNQLHLQEVLHVVDMDQGVPMCFCVADDSIAAFSSNGSLLCYPSSENSTLLNQAAILQSCGVIQLIAISTSAHIAVAVNTSGWAWYIQLNAAKTSARSSFSGVKPLEHPDLVCSLAFSPNGDSFATGCISGVVTLWRIEMDTLDVIQTNQVALHSSAITALAFSPNSTTLFTSSADGSAFLLAVGKLPSKQTSAGASTSNNKTTNTRSEGPIYTVSDAVGDNSAVTLQEQMQYEVEKELRAAHKFKCMGISAAVQEIQNRLNILIKQNGERTELEQLGLEDFVVDLMRRQEVEKENRERVASLRNQYFLRRKWLELLATRLKNITWDTALQSSVVLKPFTGVVEVEALEAQGVTSFALPRLSAREEAMLVKLKRLRLLEIRCMRGAGESGNVRRLKGSSYYRCAWAASLRGCPGEVGWLVNDGLCWPLLWTLEDTVAAATGAVPSGGNAGAASGAAGPATTSGVGNSKIPGTTTVGGEEAAGGGNGGGGGNGDDDEEASLLSHEDYYEVDENELLNLVYAPQTVRSIVQKRNQILFLKEVVQRVKERFNEAFSKLQREKEDAIAFIDSRNERISAILEELHQTETVWRPRWSDEEKAGSAVEVSPEEMVTKPYESEEARQQRLRETEEKARRQAGDEQQAERERALVDMMRGTLEVKRDVFAEALLLQRPPWMDTLTPAEMTDVQLREFEAYQSKLRELQEEQAHYRKTLEQEMKKLKVEISDCCKAFNDKLEALHRVKVVAKKEVLAQEVAIARIAGSLVQADHLRAASKRHDSKLQEVRKERTEVKSRNEKVNKSLDGLKERISEVQEEEKAMDKSFRRDLQNLCNNTFDQESLKIFTALYRKRIYPRGGLAYSGDNYNDQSDVDVSASASHRFRRSVKDASSSRRKTSNTSSRRGDLGATKSNANKSRMRSSRNVSSSAAAGANNATNAKDSALGPMQQAAQALLNTEAESNSAIKEKDPFFVSLQAKEKTKRLTEAQIPLVSPLSMELDCPEGFVVDQFSWSKLQELRNARIEKEIEAKLLLIEQNEARAKMAMLEQEESRLNDRVNEGRQARDESTTELARTETDLEVIVTLLQGQDEVDRDAVATEYLNALLCPVDVIAKYNARIKDLGNEKIAILAKTKVFRRKINLIGWDAKHQGLQAKHFEAYYTDLQLFRVTRDLQKVILEGETANNQKDRVEKVANRKDFLAKDYQDKTNQCAKTLLALQKSLHEKERESKQLLEAIVQLGVEVQQSESIKQSKEVASGGEGLATSQALKKMQKIVQRRKLIDLARVQAEEIELLRQELDRMRQRTFPSFVKATKKRLTNAPF
eukprot:gene926-1008_t